MHRGRRGSGRSSSAAVACWIRRSMINSNGLLRGRVREPSAKTDVRCPSSREREPWHDTRRPPTGTVSKTCRHRPSYGSRDSARRSTVRGASRFAKHHSLAKFARARDYVEPVVRARCRMNFTPQMFASEPMNEEGPRRPSRPSSQHRQPCAIPINSAVGVVDIPELSLTDRRYGRLRLLGSERGSALSAADDEGHLGRCAADVDDHDPPDR
jgi:hypothetical protein